MWYIAIICMLMYKQPNWKNCFIRKHKVYVIITERVNEMLTFFFFVRQKSNQPVIEKFNLKDLRCDIARLNVFACSKFEHNCLKNVPTS